ncbi:hypothetical protein A4A49_04144 [Nicotiana attenuata]|uniref:Uncharacterized protein n=1 Tax=Nicotiana attenuata TaxID=49451 RepID=A0A314LB11_NICAT|nr:hypothetical protein A4A49_04144 [Nicotiana attenuata]
MGISNLTFLAYYDVNPSLPWYIDSVMNENNILEDILVLSSIRTSMAAVILDKFSNGNPESWVYWAERYFKFLGFSEEDWLPLPYFYLEGEALAWFDWLHRNKQFYEWNHFKEKLFLRFRKWTFADSNRSVVDSSLAYPHDVSYATLCSSKAQVSPFRSNFYGLESTLKVGNSEAKHVFDEMPTRAFAKAVNETSSVKAAWKSTDAHKFIFPLWSMKNDLESLNKPADLVDATEDLDCKAKLMQEGANAFSAIPLAVPYGQSASNFFELEHLIEPDSNTIPVPDGVAHTETLGPKLSNGQMFDKISGWNETGSLISFQLADTRTTFKQDSICAKYEWRYKASNYQFYLNNNERNVDARGGSRYFVGSDDEIINTVTTCEGEDKACFEQKIGEMDSRLDKFKKELRKVAALEIVHYSVISEHEYKACFEQKIGEMDSRLDKFKKELRKVAALEIVHYSVISEHECSVYKLHISARHLSKLYHHACKYWCLDKRATVAKNIVSSLVLVSIILRDHAFQKALKRLYPVVNGWVMEQCVAKLDGVKFNMVFHESACEIPTVALYLIADSKELHIPALCFATLFSWELFDSRFSDPFLIDVTPDPHSSLSIIIAMISMLFYSNLEDKVLIEDGGIVMNENNILEDILVNLASYVWDPG